MAKTRLTKLSLVMNSATEPDDLCHGLRMRMCFTGTNLGASSLLMVCLRTSCSNHHLLHRPQSSTLHYYTWRCSVKRHYLPVSSCHSDHQISLHLACLLGTPSIHSPRDHMSDLSPLVDHSLSFYLVWNLLSGCLSLAVFYTGRKRLWQRGHPCPWTLCQSSLWTACLPRTSLSFHTSACLL